MCKANQQRYGYTPGGNDGSFCMTFQAVPNALAQLRCAHTNAPMPMHHMWLCSLPACVRRLARLCALITLARLSVLITRLQDARSVFRDWDCSFLYPESFYRTLVCTVSLPGALSPIGPNGAPLGSYYPFVGPRFLWVIL